MNYFQTNYGTERGFIRHSLALLEHYSGTTRVFRDPDLSKVQRIVFVCLGNICRSAYAVEYTRSLFDIEITSFGLAAATGTPAWKIAQKIALERNVDLSNHQATDYSDFEVKSGDLYLMMEIRHARKLNELLGDREDVQIAMLGNWATPLKPHIHDPHTLSEAYFRTCFDVIESALHRLSSDWTNMDQKNQNSLRIA